MNDLFEANLALIDRVIATVCRQAYLAVVIQNFLHDQRTQALGRWRPSREAERLGDAGVTSASSMPIAAGSPAKPRA